jgi:adenylate cyclase
VSEQGSKRRLAAVFAADVAGYSRLMEADEEATIAALGQARAVFREQIDGHGGRLVDTAGDSVLAVFESVVEAVRCALGVQKALGERDAGVPEDRRMRFRIGVNLGDIVEQADGTVYGDGVNIAARLESLAEPGGITLSDEAHRHVEGKLAVGFAFIGEQQVKNIARPVRTYRVVPEGAPASAAAPARSRAVRPSLLAAAAAVVVIVGAVALWQGGFFGGAGDTDAEQSDDPLLAMPTGPTIAVLPFANLSGDPEQDYFSDGLTEDLITELARVRVPDIRVLARNTTFQYKGQAVDVQEVARTLGADYVVEGSVRKAGERLRINAQLIDASDGAHVWAERYDRPLTDVFAVQDEITSKIVSNIAGSQGVLHREGAERTSETATGQAAAYDHLLRARSVFYKLGPQSYREAKALLIETLEIAPNYARAHQELAYVLLMGWILRFEEAPKPPAELKEYAIRSVELDSTDPLAHRTAAFAYFFDHDLDRFEYHADQALRLAPYDAEIYSSLGCIIGFTGQWERASSWPKRLSLSMNSPLPGGIIPWLFMMPI